jgi:hypothetical protein
MSFNGAYFNEKFSDKWSSKFKEKRGKALPINISPYGQCEITHVQMELGREKRIIFQTHCAFAF